MSNYIGGLFNNNCTLLFFIILFLLLFVRNDYDIAGYGCKE